MAYIPCTALEYVQGMYHFLNLFISHETECHSSERIVPSERIETLSSKLPFSKSR